MKNFATILLIILLAYGCSISPNPISYGSDSCHFCSMTIVDRQHAAQFVTEKGKAFKFDASECMMNHVKGIDKSKNALFLVNDYNEPGKLIRAEQATFLISENIPSPMGEFLTAFSSVEDAEKAQQENSGELLTWQELKNRFKK